MKPTSTLKKALKPPFTHCGTPVGNVTCRTVEGLRRLADVRGWGFFQYFENGEALQDEFKEFLVEALNEKWERDYGEPLRWILVNEQPDNCAETCCPRCECNVCQIGHGVDFYDYCPSCGVRLLPSEEENNENDTSA